MRRSVVAAALAAAAVTGQSLPSGESTHTLQMLPPPVALPYQPCSATTTGDARRRLAWLCTTTVDDRD
eukprot:gene35231-52831_t